MTLFKEIFINVILYYANICMCRIVKNISLTPGLENQRSLPKTEHPIVRDLPSIIQRSEEMDVSHSCVIDTDGLEPSTELCNDLHFAESIRKVFLNYFVEHFSNYENFIVMPNQTYSQWLHCREQFQNFDKTSFLSDQPSQCREFYSAFLETNMFITFIDCKIIASWDPTLAESRVQIFDAHISQHKQSSGIPTSSTAAPCKLVMLLIIIILIAVIQSLEILPKSCIKSAVY